jgi:hypothetical protein
MFLHSGQAARTLIQMRPQGNHLPASRNKTTKFDCATQQFVILGAFMAFSCLPAGVTNTYKRKGRHHQAAAQV